MQRIAADSAAARGITRAAATAELRELAAHWLGEGLLHDAAAESPPGPRRDPARFDFPTRDYRLLDTAVRPRFDGAAIEALVHPAFAHLEVGSAGVRPEALLTALHILDWHYIIAGEQVLYVRETMRQLVARLKVEVEARAISRQHHILHLHAAAVLHAGWLILQAAESGGGKTVLTAR
jgi:hypothetical protein